jgi:hypothetical protein
VTVILAVIVLLHVLQAITTAAVLGWLVLPSSPSRPVSAWWHRRIVIAMQPVPARALRKRAVIA